MAEEKVKIGTTGGPSTADKDAKLLGALCYLINFVLLPWSFVVYFIKKEDKFIRFHALQAGFLWIVALIVGIILSVLAAISTFAGPLVCVVGLLQLVVSLAFLVAFLYGAWMAYKGVGLMLPIIGEYARKQTG